MAVNHLVRGRPHRAKHKRKTCLLGFFILTQFDVCLLCEVQSLINSKFISLFERVYHRPSLSLSRPSLATLSLHGCRSRTGQSRGAKTGDEERELERQKAGSAVFPSPRTHAGAQVATGFKSLDFLLETALVIRQSSSSAPRYSPPEATRRPRTLAFAYPLDPQNEGNVWRPSPVFFSL